MTHTSNDSLETGGYPPGFLRNNFDVIGATYIENHVKVVWLLLISQVEVIVYVVKCTYSGDFGEVKEKK